jgi:hypothetical protein
MAIKATFKKALNCPLKLDCFPSCFWWKDAKCSFPREVKQEAEMENKSRMNKSKNPYPKFLIDEASGIEVTDFKHKIWAEGYKAGRKDSSAT